MNVHGENEVYFHTFLTSALEISIEPHYPAALPSRKDPSLPIA